MSVYVSNRHVYVQFIDDENGKTLASASSMAKKGDERVSLSVENAGKIGQRAAASAIKQGIKKVVFDRGGFAFGGRMSALADAARKEGLVF